MSVFALFVTPGVRDAAAAKARYEGEDEAWAGVSAERIREVAEELKRAHGLRVDEELEKADDDAPAIDLEEARGVVGFDVHVDRWGALVSFYGGDSAEETEGNMARGIAATRTVARLLEGSVYEPEYDRLVDVSRDGADITRAANEAFERPSPMEAGQRRASMASLLFGLFPLVCIIVTRTFLRGFTAFLVMFGVMAATGVFAVWWSRRPATRKPAVAPPPQAVSGSDANRPIRPS